ncbi:hypothetical protein HYS03_02425 [Candidatus Woesebacteria bacterium]|nr:hypothetical protein [Candidatus Woesebacteria bacterium]QQG47138.1 MAG: hypothetical protein HY044_03270 [Candidatus Woesebacteria bacterium]
MYSKKLRGGHEDFISSARNLYEFLKCLDIVAGVAPCRIIPGHGHRADKTKIKVVNETGCLRVKVIESNKFQFLQIYSSNIQGVKTEIERFAQANNKFEFIS